MMGATASITPGSKHDFTTAYWLEDGTMVAIRVDGTKFLCKNINDIEDIEADETRRQEQKRFAYLRR